MKCFNTFLFQDPPQVQTRGRVRRYILYDGLITMNCFLRCSTDLMSEKSKLSQRFRKYRHLFDRKFQNFMHTHKLRDMWHTFQSPDGYKIALKTVRCIEITELNLNLSRIPYKGKKTMKVTSEQACSVRIETEQGYLFASLSFTLIFFLLFLANRLIL